MTIITNTLIPIILIIITGYTAIKLRYFPSGGVGSLLYFVNNFATPCLLFYSIIRTDLSSTYNVNVIVSFYVSAILCFIIGIFFSRNILKTPPEESVSTGFASAFTNTVLMGLPILTLAFGTDALPITLSIIGLHAAILLTIGILTMEFVVHGRNNVSKTIQLSIRRIFSNPLIWGISFGLMGSLSGISLYQPLDIFFSMMAAAVVPVSLFGLGGALAGYRLQEDWQTAAVASVIKLILHPFLAYVLMVVILKVPLETARYGILLAAMPSGINVFIYAAIYNTGTGIAATTILMSTLCSFVTISFWLFALS